MKARRGNRGRASLEVELYAQQRQSVDAAELCALILPFFERWLDIAQTVASGTLELLTWGEHSLHAAYPSLPEPTRPAPAEEMADIWRRTNPRFGDRVRAGTSFS